MKESVRYHSREWFRRRIKTLNERTCTSTAQLQATLNELAELSVSEMRAMVAKAIFDGFTRLVETTPKDTGRAQAGWQIGTDTSVLDVEPPVVKRPEGKNKGKKDGKKAGGNDILPEYAAMIRATLQQTPVALTPADVIYIVNNVEYIMMLEAGWSRQAPHGFIGNFLSTLQRELNMLATEFGAER
ncbi:hypothetical protein [uncultured Desulfovibrio sp.]|uniref:hypothetical protein n=1 Tax=uncultured Desulfovibrio sp. TaxID=167968 RepID=UPI00272D54D0|nr:hypothetical protein [uncultured Desulfovibrio sp.]